MAYSRVEVYWFNRVGDLFQGANNLESSVEGNGMIGFYVLRRFVNLI